MFDPPSKLTRRSALALMGIASVAATAAVAPASAEEPPKPSLTQKYIFGYGSLIQTASRTRTAPKAFAASPVIVKGICAAGITRPPASARARPTSVPWLTRMLPPTA